MIKKTAQDFLPKIELEGLKGVLDSYIWVSKDQQMWTGKNSKQVWMLFHTCEKKNHELQKASMVFPTRTEAINVAKQLYPDVDFSSIKRKGNLIYAVKDTPLHLAGKTGVWRCSLYVFEKDENGKSKYIEKYRAIEKFMKWELEPEVAKSFWQPSKKKAIQVMLDFLHETFPQFMQTETWAWK